MSGIGNTVASGNIDNALGRNIMGRQPPNRESRTTINATATIAAEPLVRGSTFPVADIWPCNMK